MPHHSSFFYASPNSPLQSEVIRLLNQTMTPDIQNVKISELKGFEQVSSIIAGRSLLEFDYVHSFCYFGQIEDELGNRWSDIELVMEKTEPPFGQIGFRFHQVADVSFSGFGQITGLYFQSIADRGWEWLRFEVGDYEESRIHLFCQEIFVFDPSKTASQRLAN